MAVHTVKAYDAELEVIDRKIAEMGGIAEKMLADSMEALTRLDVELARRVVESDPRLDALQREIEEQAVLTIARRQPMAVDLRELVGAIHIAGDLERTGDLAKNIAKRTIKISADARVPRAIVGIKHMGELASMQMKDVLDAYIDQDAVKAMDVWERDAPVDELYNSLFRELLTYMMEDARSITPCTHLLFAAKNVERMGDHVTNLAEIVFYLVNGEILEDTRPKGDRTSFTVLRPNED